MFGFQSHRMLLSFTHMPYLTTILQDREVPSDGSLRARLCPMLAWPIPRSSNVSHFSGYDHSRVQITYNTTMMSTDNYGVIQVSEIRNFGDSVKMLLNRPPLNFCPSRGSSLLQPLIRFESLMGRSVVPRHVNTSSRSVHVSPINCWKRVP
jgi:hypothetical protein